MLPLCEEHNRMEIENNKKWNEVVSRLDSHGNAIRDSKALAMEIKNLLVSIDEVLRGTYDKRGLISTVKNHDDCLSAMKRTGYDVVGALFKVISGVAIGVTIAFIVMKTGLK